MQYPAHPSPANPASILPNTLHPNTKKPPQLTPHNTNPSPRPLPHRLRRPRNRPNRNTMISTQRQHQPPLPRMLIYLPGQRLRHCTDRPRLLHVAVGGVFGG